MAAGAAIVLLAIAGSAAAQVTVRMPHVTAARGSTVSVPVYLENVGAEQIASVEVYLAYDPGQLSFMGIQFFDPTSQPTLLESWLVDLTGSLEGLGTYLDSSRVTGGALDILKIAAATGLSSADRLAADGVLFFVDFAVPDDRAPLTIPLDLTHVLLDDSAPNVEDGSISLTGTDGTIQVAPALLARNQAIQVTVEDIDEDRTAGPDDILVQVTNGTQTEVLSVYETGDTGGVFAGSISAVFSIASTVSGDGIVQVDQGDTIVFCYDDLLDGLGAESQRYDSTAVDLGTLGEIDATVAAQPADLVRIRVVDADLNVDPASRDTVSVVVTTVSPVDGPKDEEMILLEEVDVDADILFGQFPVVQGTGAGSDGDVNAQRADTLFITYEDVATGAGAAMTLQDTCIVVDPWGDASGDGKLRGFDASRILFHAVDIIELTGLDSLAANVDSLAPFGPINEFDASLVLQKRVGLIDRFPVQEKTAVNHPQPESGQSAPKQPAVERIVALEEGPGHLALMAEERAGIVAGELVVRGFEGRAAMADELGDFLLVAARADQETRILFAGARSAAGPGPLVRLFPAAGDRVELVRATFNGGRIVGLPGAGPTAVLPARFVLEPNAPNPFNPETLIRYALPRAGRVRLEIFNLAGQRIRTLVEEEQPAGTHRAVWDGRDAEGTQAAGGVYFYRLTAKAFSKGPGFEAVRRMVLIK